MQDRWPWVRIEVRADAGFAVPALYDACEAAAMPYTIGLILNRGLEALAAPLLAQAAAQYAETAEGAPDR